MPTDTSVPSPSHLSTKQLFSDGEGPAPIAVCSLAETSAFADPFAPQQSHNLECEENLPHM